MTLEELWELFPIILTEHKSYWKDWYIGEENRINDFLSFQNIRISHIGSTAINGIWAKPIIDILLEIPQSISMEKIKSILIDNGYICMSESIDRKSFNKGYTSDGYAQKVFHLHLRYHGDNAELYFRDYLNENPQVAKDYETLKLSLWKKFEHNRDAYTNAKKEFVEKYTNIAREKYNLKYKL